MLSLYASPFPEQPNIAFLVADRRGRAGEGNYPQITLMEALRFLAKPPSPQSGLTELPAPAKVQKTT
jgi:hypothetical protein